MARLLAWLWGMGFILLVSEGRMRPLHATWTSNGEWICNPGYFKTEPAKAADATCKACSTGITAARCKTEERFVPCSPWNNARCEPCPSIMMMMAQRGDTAEAALWSYAPGYHDCQTMQCVEGTFEEKGSQKCVLCPVDSFCKGGVRLPCPEDTVAPAQGAKDALQCLPTQSQNASQEVELNMLWTTSTKVEAAQLAARMCPNLMEVVGHWLKFGKLLECHVGVANYSQTIGGVQCTVVTAKALATEYTQWLGMSAAAQRTAWIQPFLQGCLGRVDLQVTEVSVRPLTLTMSGGDVPSKTNASVWGANSTTFPRLRYERRKWGTAQGDVVMFVAATAVLAVGMCTSMGMLLCVLVYPLRLPQQ